VRVPREILLRFLAQLEAVVPVPVASAEDMLAFPPAVRERIMCDLAIEELEEAQRMETDR